MARDTFSGSFDLPSVAMLLRAALKMTKVDSDPFAAINGRAFAVHDKEVSCTSAANADLLGSFAGCLLSEITIR